MVASLDFGNVFHTQNNLLNIVDYVLSFHNLTYIQRFRFQVAIKFEFIHAFGHQICDWISFTSHRHVQEIVLDLYPDHV